MLLAPVPAMIRDLIVAALRDLGRPADPGAVVVERPRDPSHGHYASNVALVEGKRARANPRAIADALAERIVAAGRVRVEVAGPGFLNFTAPADVYQDLVAEILARPDAALRSCAPGLAGGARRRRVLVEFVSANPTGPLNVVSARAAAVGDTLARLLDASGFEVTREFYVNDAGNQANLLGESLRIALSRERSAWPPPDLPDGAYGGAYVFDLAEEARRELPEVVDARLAEEERRARLRDFAIERLVARQKADLEAFGVGFDRWFRETELHARAAPRAALDALRARGHVYDADGASWFRSTAFGDEQDRVLLKAGGVPTYFLADIAYHRDKLERGCDVAIDLWGPDHHGHIPRMTWAMEAAGAPPGWLEILIVQQVNLIRDGHVVKMSKRKGEFLTLEDVLEELSRGRDGSLGAGAARDVARWFFLMRRCESHLDFDLALALDQSDENPVYYVQYAHARIAGLFAHAREAGVAPPADAGLAPLVESEAVELMRVLSEGRATVAQAALAREPHRMTTYLTDVAAAFHGFYHHHQIVVPGDARTTAARLSLCRATQTVLREGLALLGVSAPERM
jgi:arginyl-tRNA synthetase